MKLMEDPFDETRETCVSTRA